MERHGTRNGVGKMKRGEKQKKDAPARRKKEQGSGKQEQEGKPRKRLRLKGRTERKGGEKNWMERIGVAKKVEGESEKKNTKEQARRTPEK